MPYVRYNEDDIKQNVLAIYEIYSEDRKTCPLINCEQNKIFIRNFEKFKRCATNPNTPLIYDNDKFTFNEKKSTFSLSCSLKYNIEDDLKNSYNLANLDDKSEITTY